MCRPRPHVPTLQPCVPIHCSPASPGYSPTYPVAQPASRGRGGAAAAARPCRTHPRALRAATSRPDSPPHRRVAWRVAWCVLWRVAWRVAWHVARHIVWCVLWRVAWHVARCTCAIIEGGRRPAGDLQARDQQSEPTATGQLVHSPLADATVGGRLRLCATQGPSSGGVPTAAEQAEVLRVLTGRL